MTTTTILTRKPLSLLRLFGNKLGLHYVYINIAVNVRDIRAQWDI